MLDILLYILLAAVLGGGAFFGYIFLQSYLNGASGAGSFFGPKPEKRLDVVEQWSLDARRRLVLIRRDDVEHLIMTGGPVDIVIETGIGEPARKTAPATTDAVFSRPARPLGTAATPNAAPQPTINGAKAE